MPQAPFEQVLGTIGRHRVTVRAADGSAVPFLATDPLSAALWAGDDRASAVEPAVAWEDAPAGVLTLTITAAMTAGLVPGTYRLQVFCTPPSDGERRCLLDGSVRFLPTPGSAPAAKVYASYDDLLNYCPGVETLADETSGQMGFAEQRARARSWLDEEILRYYHPVPGRARRMVVEEGAPDGPYVKYADPPEGASVPSDAALRAILDADGLDVTPILKECVSHKAAAIIYKASPVGAYAAEGGRHESEARMHYYRAIVEVKSDPSLASPDLRIGRDVTFLT